ncbi:hypothetical protein TNCT_87371 [Trichonephila clavata]|uniref:Endonuclease/exonuclease/phosphatase domain-containing protein n=1 Tax=Trichonephila clavata TaxID=2740835 RepID=A0A8X6G0Q3_TRICU|nr:hypothetical protein TNCT_87371 [Trichonephila clavata]
MPHPPLQAIETTIVILTPPERNPISIISVAIPPKSNKHLFTIDLENLLQTSSNCVVFGNFNFTHNVWNCKVNSNRGVRLLNFAHILNLNIAFPETPTRIGINSANTIDIALIRHFYFPFSIFSLQELSSDYNPVYYK